MKSIFKISSFIVVFVCSFVLLVGNVKADTIGKEQCSLELSLKDSNPREIKLGEEYTVYVSFSKLAVSVDTIFYDIIYDPNFLQPVVDGIEGMNEWTDSINTSEPGTITVLIENTKSFNSVNLPIQKVVFKVIKDADNTAIQMQGINPAGMGQDYYEDGVSNTLKIGKDLSDSDTCGEVEFSMTSSSAIKGKQITIPIIITKNTGFNALGIEITYDSNVFQYKKMDIVGDVQNKIDLSSVYLPSGENVIKASFVALDNVENLGLFANVTFDVKDSAVIEGDTNVKLDIIQITNKEEKNVTGVGTEINIPVKDKENEISKGDVNGDGKIDLIDAVYILQYYNNVRTLSEEQLIIADVNNSGNVSLIDALLIIKFFHGEIARFVL